MVVCVLAGFSLTSARARQPYGDPASEAAKLSNLKAAGESSLYVELVLSKPAKLAALKTGDVVEGRLSRDVYCGDAKLFPSGSAIRLTVDKLERRRKESNDHWPGVFKLFMPRHENYPTFQAATVLAPDGVEVPLQVSLISASSRLVKLTPKARTAEPA